MENVITTTHALDFEVSPWWRSNDIALFRIGTCHGQWGCDETGYFILTVINETPGNGHLQDVFEWFEFAAKRDKKMLRVLAIMNERFYQHLITKRGFLSADSENVYKIPH